MITRILAEHMAATHARVLSETVRDAAIHHLVDTIAAMISGGTIGAGHGAVACARAFAGVGHSSVVGTDLVTSAENAALANGMLAHADESDDSHGLSVTHPGCSVIPAALAIGEARATSGQAFLRAIVAGYDIGTRVAMALGGGGFMERYHHCSFGGIFGATAASAALLKLDAAGCARALTFAVHLASGSTCWIRDPAHVEKGFVFGGLPAHSGVKAALLAEVAIATSSEPLEGVPGMFSGYAETANPALAIEALGERFEVTRTAIKKWCVGSPAQAALDSIQSMLLEHRFAAEDVAEILVTLPQRRVLIVNSGVSNLNLSHLLSIFIIDGGATFASVHDHARMDDPEVLRLRDRIRIEPRPGAGRRDHAVITLTLRDGRVLERKPQTVRGQPDDPMSTAEVMAKAEGLIEPVLGAGKTRDLLGALQAVENLPDLRALRPMLRP